MVETGNLRRMGGELPLGSDPISVRRRGSDVYDVAGHGPPVDYERVRW